MLDPSPLSRLFAALLGLGAVGFLSVLFVFPSYYKLIPRSVTLVTRALYCAVAVGYAVAAYFELREPHAGGTIVFILAGATMLNLIAIALERFFLWRHQRATNKPD
jgi:hypothetical protein